MNVRFSGREVRDLGAAWVALGLAFTFFFGGGAQVVRTGGFGELLVVSLATAGVGFLLHELAHKVVAVRYGQIAEFRADYGMLLLAVASGLAGFLFAAPGAVHHRGRITKRQNGLIAVAGPVTNLVLAGLFLPLVLVPASLVGRIGTYGVLINVLLAAFNMLPFGPLDGRTVAAWSKVAFGLTFLVALGASALAVLTLWL